MIIADKENAHVANLKKNTEYFAPYLAKTRGPLAEGGRLKGSLENFQKIIRGAKKTHI